MPHFVRPPQILGIKEARRRTSCGTRLTFSPFSQIAQHSVKTEWLLRCLTRCYVFRGGGGARIRDGLGAGAGSTRCEVRCLDERWEVPESMSKTFCLYIRPIQKINHQTSCGWDWEMNTIKNIRKYTTYSLSIASQEGRVSCGASG